MNTIFAHDGECGFSGIWIEITSAKGFDGVLLDVPSNAQKYARFTGGATAVISAGETITGGTSSKTAIIVGVAAENGAIGDSDAEGIIMVTGTSGAFQAETITSSGTGTVAIAQDFISNKVAGLKPKAALITVETAPIKFTLDGTNPTATAGTNFGHQMDAGQSYVVRGWSNIRKFRCINAVASNGAIVKYSLFY